MWIWHYTLVPRRALSPIAGARPREGALLRDGDGFADIHPWPELGDVPLGQQLAMLARGETTPLTRRSIEMARIDGAARARRVSLFDGLIIPRSHWPGTDPPPGFDTVKLKGIDQIPSGVRLRIDFNGSLSPEAFMLIAAGLPSERIDFVEDPCEYDAAVWTALREQTGLRLALDRPSMCGGSPPPSAVDVLVVKPAIEDVPRDPREIVITSTMDHPIGQFGAAYFAAKFGAARCGLFTHVLYQSNEFIDRIRSDGARLLPPEGTGIGFDDLLERLPWKTLA